MAGANEPGSGSAGREDVRLRDLPAPRQVKGVIAPVFRVIFAWPYRAVLLGLYRAGIRPWQLTLASFLNNVVVGWLLLKDLRFLPARGGVTVVQRGWFAVRRLATPVGTPDTGTSSVPPP